jgi:hypothetical protein
VPWLTPLAAASHRAGPGSIPESVPVGFVVDKVALRQGFPQGLRFSHGKGQEIIIVILIIIIVIFIIELHKKL